jgi:ubiquinone/menaquinone biosynthesis C-methylase UbiE
MRMDYVTSMSGYDALAPRFDRDRSLPEGVANAVRAAVLGAVPVTRPSVLDLGAGTGRVGWPFVAAGDDYIGADLSLGMLSAFAARCAQVPRLIQADARRLPFRDAAFDLVMLVQVFGGLHDWRRFTDDVIRVLRLPGTIVIGRTLAPEGGLDARMKEQLREFLDPSRAAGGGNARQNVERAFGARAARTGRQIVSTWNAERTPRQFIVRHSTGARFSGLPESIKVEAMRGLAAWAEQTFGSLDAVSLESHSFELQLFSFEGVHA